MDLTETLWHCHCYDLWWAFHSILCYCVNRSSLNLSLSSWADQCRSQDGSDLLGSSNWHFWYLVHFSSSKPSNSSLLGHRLNVFTLMPNFWKLSFDSLIWNDLVEKLVHLCLSKSCFLLELSRVPHACGCFTLRHGVIHFAGFDLSISVSQWQSSCILLI